MTLTISVPSPVAALRRLFVTQDSALLDAGAAGELLIARVRIVLLGMLLLIPLRGVVAEPEVRANYVGLSVLIAANLLALVTLALAERKVHRPWFGVATSIADVTLVSVALSVFLLFGEPLTAVNSRVIFEVYFLALGAACLRYDARVCLWAGVVAVAQYLGISGYAAWKWDLAAAATAAPEYGAFDWTTQLSRSLLLLVATVLSATIVVRTGRLRLLSTVDRLTGLFNRAYFDERIQQELARARRTGLPLSVVLIDLDRFKLFNDRYGHAVGDEALRVFANVLRHAVRASDVVGRYGGEEFVLMMPETPNEIAAERIDVLRQAVARLGVSVPNQEMPVPVTMSAGVATWPADGDAADEIMYEADQRLLVAKRSGRDQVVGGWHRVAEAGAQ